MTRHPIIPAMAVIFRFTAADSKAMSGKNGGKAGL
jgi:hypothetical protein